MKQTKSIGKKYGRLTVLGVVGKNKHKKLIVQCVCSCGNTIKTILEYIQQGDTKSCGCLKTAGFQKMITKHRFSKTRFYGIYNAVRQRTNNPKTIGWKHYGGRGIKCLWNSFPEFHKDMYKNYRRHVRLYGEKQTTIDRINPDGNYCKQNCRWATRKEQGNHRRNTRFITVGKSTKTIQKWSTRMGIKASLISIRIDKLYWPPEEAVGIKRRNHNF